MHMNIYDIRRFGTAIFVVVSVAVVVLFLLVSHRLVQDLAQQERERMQIWAEATRQLADPEASVDNIDFLLGIIEQNRSIPVVLADAQGRILRQRNFELPEAVDAEAPEMLSEVNRAYLRGKIPALRNRGNLIEIATGTDTVQYIYYDDSTLLRRLSLYPYIQLLVMVAFLLVMYWALTSTKRAEQNKVWVGLSKETAHQLGTPISSLMAWMELLRQMGVEPETVGEMDKDVRRLETIASRFSKIGSRPQMERGELGEVVAGAVGYMSTRISSRITLTMEGCGEALEVEASAPLLEWVMENLIKNAVDAMEGKGSITVRTLREGQQAVVTVTDTGKGISRKNQKTIFNPGYTTKKRGWGLGLTLAKRIIEQYHRGEIFVSWSEPGRGTQFKIRLPLQRQQAT